MEAKENIKLALKKLMETYVNQIEVFIDSRRLIFESAFEGLHHAHEFREIVFENDSVILHLEDKD